MSLNNKHFSDVVRKNSLSSQYSIIPFGLSNLIQWHIILANVPWFKLPERREKNGTREEERVFLIPFSFLLVFAELSKRDPIEIPNL